MKDISHRLPSRVHLPFHYFAFFRQFSPSTVEGRKNNKLRKLKRFEFDIYELAEILMRLSPERRRSEVT